MSHNLRYISVHAGHDANVTVMDDQCQVLFAAGEERFNRQKMYAGFPVKAIRYAVDHYGPSFLHIATPRMRFRKKILRELGFFANSFRKNLAAPRFGVWLQNGFKKLFIGRTLEQDVPKTGIDLAWPVFNVEHHDAHAAGAFYHSGFGSCYVMTLDGEGDGYSCCFYRADHQGLHRFRAFYHNEITCGRDYEKVTAMLGFHPLRHPGKITGLAAFGRHDPDCVHTLEHYLKTSWRADKHKILSTADAYQVITTDGKAALMKDRENIFGRFSREDMAFAIQYLTETTVLSLIKQQIPRTASESIALSGGVFANVALNKKIKDLGFSSIFIQPAMSDCGLSLGAMLYSHPDKSRLQGISNVFYGPSYTPDEIKILLESQGIAYEAPDDLPNVAAHLLADGKVLARFDGAMEYGPRALGNRSILYHAGDKSVNDWLNKQLNRTEFMPFAPVILERFAQEYLVGYTGAERTAKFMTITFECTEKMKRDAPAVVHVDGTARPQVLGPDDNPGYAAILEAYYQLTGIPILVNTSFNMHEEPIVMTPEDALRAFYASHLDALILGPFLIRGSRAMR